MGPAPKEIIVATIQTTDLQASIDNATGNIILSGIEGKFLKMLMDILNVPYKLVSTPDGEWGRELDNGSWTGMIGMVSRGEADMALNQISVTDDRFEVARFSTPYTEEIIKFIAPAPKRISSPIVYLYPFELSVWLVSITYLILLPLVYVLLFKDIQMYTSMFFRLFGSVLKQNLFKDSRVPIQRFFILLCLIFSMVLSYSYCAVLLSFSSIPLYQSRLRTFKDLSESVVAGQHKCQVWLGSFILSLLVESTDESLKKLGDIIMKNSWTFDLTNFQHRKFDDKTVTVSSVLALRSLYKGETNIIFSEDSLITTSISVAMKENFYYEEKINTIIERMKSAGLYVKFESKESMSMFLFNANANLMVKREDPIDLHEMYGAFLVLLCGYISSLLALVGELIIAYVYAKNK